MSKKIDVEKTAIYYQQFHHACVTWYITIMGFFIAGVIASPKTVSGFDFIWLPLVICAAIMCILFFFCIFHYGARIRVLTLYLEGSEGDIPDNWRRCHKSVAIEVAGVGSMFFLSILISMQISLWFFIIVKFS